MTTNPLPDLSKWHEVPVDAQIPNVTLVTLRTDGSWFTCTGPLPTGTLRADLRHFTADPIPAPRPTPPTEPGTVLLDVTATTGGRTWDSAHCIDDEEPRWFAGFSTDSDLFRKRERIALQQAEIGERSAAETIALRERTIVREVQQALWEMLKEIHAVCREEKIEYSALGGRSRP